CGRTVDEMIVRNPIGIKAALGENPKAVYGEKNRSPQTRMAVAALLREYQIVLGLDLILPQDGCCRLAAGVSNQGPGLSGRERVQGAEGGTLQAGPEDGKPDTGFKERITPEGPCPQG